MIKCPICGKEMKLINTTHLKKHKLSVADFKKAYPDKPMCSSEFLDRMHIVNSEINSREDVRKKISESIKMVNDENLRMRKSKAMKQVWSSEGYREKMRIVHLDVQSSEELQMKKSNTLKNTWKIPEVREAYIRGQRKSYTDNETFIRTKKFVRETKCNGKIYFKSSWEVLVSEYLDRCNVEWEYESVWLPYIDENGVERTYIPDFRISNISGEWVMLEVKPSFFQSDVRNLLKMKYAKAQGHTIEYISEEDIKDFETFENKISVVQRLSKARQPQS